MGDQRSWIVRIVAGMWVLNLGAGMVSAAYPTFDYQPSEAVNAAFMLILGTLFVADKTLKKEAKAAEDQQPKPELEKDES